MFEYWVNEEGKECRGTEEWEGDVKGFFGNRDGGYGRCEDLVEEMVYRSVDDISRISILLEIFFQVFNFFIYICP